MNANERMHLALLQVMLFLPSVLFAQNGNPRYTQAAAGAGTVYAYMNVYNSSGTCTNSFEYQPPGFDFNDASTLYPIIIFFPGLGNAIQDNDNQGPEAPGLLTPGYTNPSIVKIAKTGLPRNILTDLAPYEITGPGGQNYSFIVVGVQCYYTEHIDNYEKFIRGYVFEKYKNKIDPSRIYITGLSLGGGKTMEFFASQSRMNLVAAAAPVAIGTECPYTPLFISSWTGPTIPPTWASCTNSAEHTQIINNLRSKPDLGIWFNHNVDDRSRAPYRISKEFFYDALMLPPSPMLPRANTGGHFDPNLCPDQNNDCHDAWSVAYYRYDNPPEYNVYNGKTMFRWFLDYSSSNTSFLPVVLRDFSAALDPAGSVSLQWTTTLESHTSHFEVERSFDGKLFSNISKVPAKGNSNTELKYTFLDQDPGESFTYYRIKIMDQDGRYEYSPTRKVSRLNRGLSFSVNPNPVNTEFTLNVSGKAILNMELILADQTGRIIKRFTAAKSRGELIQKFYLGDMAGGVYLLTIKGEGVNLTQRLVKF